MPRPWELTPEERAAEARELEPRRRAADREDAPLFRQQMFTLNASEEELSGALPHEEVEDILAYRRDEDKIG